MDFKQAQYILKVADLQSITKAANELYISQPSLSHYIAKVEEEFGTQLFNRMTNPITLTFAGEKYVEAARQIISIEHNLKEQVLDISHNKIGKIKVGIPLARASFMLPHILPLFHKSYPGIHFDLVETNSNLLEDSVLRGKIDFAICPLPLVNENLSHEILYQEELLLIAGKDQISQSDCACKNVIDFNKVKNYPFILLKKGHGIRKAVDTIFLQYGIKPHVLLETDSNETAYRLASTGLALAIVPEITLETAKYINEPDSFSLSQNGMRWDIAAVYRPSNGLNYIQREFIHLIKNIYQNGKS
jgi:DNA-binding transcriptional LysR family regulator